MFISLEPHFVLEPYLMLHYIKCIICCFFPLFYLLFFLWQFFYFITLSIKLLPTRGLWRLQKITALHTLLKYFVPICGFIRYKRFYNFRSPLRLFPCLNSIFKNYKLMDIFTGCYIARLWITESFFEVFDKLVKGVVYK